MGEPDLVRLLLELKGIRKECEWVEFKVNNSNPHEIGEYISALSNSACFHKQPFAYLVYGIEDESHEIVGTAFRPLSEKKGNEELENWLATQLNPRIDFFIHEFDYENMHFAIFKIDATRNTPVNFRGEPYIRVGSYKKSLDDHPERERKIWNNPARIFEKSIAYNDANEEDVLQLIDYPGYFEMIKFPLPDNRKGVFDRLLQDKIITLNNDGSYCISNLGAILFAKDIDVFEGLSRKAPRVVIYDGNNRIKTKKEQIGKKGYAVAFPGLIKYVTDQLPSMEDVSKPLRTEVLSYPALAIRELVANALIHQDFSIGGTSPMIEIFDNRIEITNPGKPLIDPLRFMDHSPESRNESLARFMRRLNICEERGSGIDKVIFECEFHQLPAPDFLVGDNYTRVILYAPKSLRQMDHEDKLRACYQHACLKHVSGGIMSNQTLRERFGVEDHNYATISRIIAEAKDHGLIKDYDPNNKSRTLF